MNKSTFCEMSSKRSKEFRVISSTEPHQYHIVQTIEAIKETFNWAHSQLWEHFGDDVKLKDKLNSFEQSLIDLTLVASLYNYTDTPINGLFAFVDLCLDFFHHIHRKNYFQSNRSTDNFETMINFLNADVDYLLNLHAKRVSSETDDIPSLVSKDDTDMVQALQSHDCDSNEMKIMYQHFLSFWVNGLTYNWIKFYQQILAFSVTPFPKFFKIFTDSSFRRSTCHQVMANATAACPLNPVKNIDSHWCRKVFRAIFSRNSHVTSSTFYVERQGRWTVASQGRNVIESVPEISNKLPLRFRFHKHKKLEMSCETLIFYCHGSGFIVTREEIHEVYLKKWACDLENVPILCLDYSLQPPYPIVFQEFLDAYLWVTSGSQDVLDKIGFHPKKIIISGDSAGGVLAMALLSCLSIIEAKDSAYTVHYPINMVFFYGAFMCMECFPSNLLSFYELVVGTNALLIMEGSMAGIQGVVDPKARPPKRLTRTLKYIQEDWKFLKTLFSPEHEQPWYKNGNKYDCERIAEVASNLRDTFYNPLQNFNFEKFSKIGLYLMATNRCNFLDNSVQLAKIWKGPVELHCVTSGSIHGFLMIPREREAKQFAYTLLNKAVYRN